MENINELYSQALAQLQKIHAQGKALAQSKQDLENNAQAEISRIQADFVRRRKQLEDDLATARNHMNGAKQHCTAAVRTMSAGQKPDFAKMMQLYVQMDDNDPNDPAARKLLEMASNAVRYLELEIQNLSRQESDQIRKAKSGGTGSAQLQRMAKDLTDSYDALLSGSLMQRLAQACRDQGHPFLINSAAVCDDPVPEETTEIIKLGLHRRPFQVRKDFVPRLAAMFGSYCDSTDRSLLLPFGYRTNRSVKILLTAPDAMWDQVQDGLKGLLYNILRHYVPLSGRVVYLDPITYNPDHLGVMKNFVGRDNLISFPTNDQEALRAVEQLISQSTGKHRHSRFLILRGYPAGLMGKIRDQIRHICNNAALYQITVIMVRPEQNNLHYDSQDETAMNGALRINSDGKQFILESSKAPFQFFPAPRQISPQMLQRFQQAYEPKVLGSEYPSRVDMENIAPYNKGSKRIRIPFGVDADDELCHLDFYNTNFSMYLMGAAGSGKSTLLHTIITGLIRNYHPDDVELWLADFKMSEFSQYMNPMPPHIKYILLDESAELIYDFIDLLTEKLMERKRFFAANPHLKDLESVPANVYMPTIFVIMDEFTIMSQVIANSEPHKMKLQDLLVQGRNAGFKFIFASQEYSKGVAGLTATAKDQIQTRIAMRNTVDEIRETLDIPGSQLTDEIRQWIDTLPPHVTLYKYYDAARKKVRVIRAQALYFPKKGSANPYQPQQDLIKDLRKNMTPVPRKEYNHTKITTYVEKQPVTADGTSYSAFTPQAFHRSVAEYRRANPDDIFPDDVFLSLGSPRRLLDSSLLKLLSESRENMLLFSGQEHTCSMSVVLSTIRSFLAQQGKVQVWAYHRNRLYRAYRDSHFAKCNPLETPEAIGAAIEELKAKITARTPGNELIVMLGMDRICEDLEQADFQTGASDALKKATVSTAEEQQGFERLKALRAEMNEEIEKVQQEGLAAGKSMEEIRADMQEVIRRYKEKSAANAATKPAVPAPSSSLPVKHDYLADLRQIMTRGSRYGYHFLLCCRDGAEFRQSKATAELFRHRLAFRISGDDASLFFGNNRAARLPQHVCLYTSDYSVFTFRPFLHRGVTWDDWEVDENGNASHFIYKRT